MIVLGTLLAAASFCFAPGTTEKKTGVKKVVITQMSASSGKEMFTKHFKQSKARDLAGSGRQEDQPFFLPFPFADMRGSAGCGLR